MDYLPDGRVKSFRPERVVFSYSCGIYSWVFDTATKKPERQATATAAVSIPRLGISYPEIVSYVLGTTTTISLADTAKATSRGWSDVMDDASLTEKFLIPLGGLMLTAGGVGVGIYMGFDQRVKCGEPLFQKLLDDPVFWEGVTKSFLDDHTWNIFYSDQLPPTELFRRGPKWASAEYASSLQEEQDEIKSGVKFMRIVPLKDRLIVRSDFLSEGRLAGVLDWNRPIDGKDGVQLSPLNLSIPSLSDESYCLPPDLPDHLAEITAGLAKDADNDLCHMRPHRSPSAVKN